MALQIKTYPGPLWPTQERIPKLSLHQRHHLNTTLRPITKVHPSIQASAVIPTAKSRNLASVPKKIMKFKHSQKGLANKKAVNWELWDWFGEMAITALRVSGVVLIGYMYVVAFGALMMVSVTLAVASSFAKNNQKIKNR
ncbi:hypothetical protein BP5796_01334 [Coleophoma crateriformis]|uniref:Uncharacterized protein n=1 Tax=Coleophoma crateriformis TaxID=565419 RepID=A0A3D8T085_9HELO|nr:hypothetical protein BP5796_01334 [Coleophoma crateriformis]